MWVFSHVSVLTNERYTTYQTGFPFQHLGLCPRVDFLGAEGAQGVKNDFIWTWSFGISNWRGWRAEQNTSKMFTLWSNWWPWGEVNRSNIITVQLQSQFQSYFYEIIFVFSQIKDKKNYLTDFLFCCLGHAPVVGLGVLWSKTLAWGCAMAPHRLRVLVYI